MKYTVKEDTVSTELLHKRRTYTQQILGVVCLASGYTCIQSGLWWQAGVGSQNKGNHQKVWRTEDER